MDFHYDSFVLGTAVGVWGGLAFFWLGYWGANFFYKWRK